MTKLSRDELIAKYGIHNGPGCGVQEVTPEQAAATAWAEQVERTIREVHRACEAYNANGYEGDDQLGWLLWELPPELRERIEGVRARLREAQSRQSRSGGQYLYYYDDRNEHDQDNGWPAYDPDNPDHQTVPLGTVVADPHTVHVLRGGTEPLFDRRDGLGRYQRPGDLAPPNAGLADYGHAYDFATFMRAAAKTNLFKFCDLHLPDGCKNPFGGRNHRVVAVPLGQHIFVLSICRSCMKVLAKSWRHDHPKVTVGAVRKHSP